MNNYKFRGKQCWLDDDGKKVYGKWVYGYLMDADKICPPKIDLTAPDFFDLINFVDPKTVGQWTGLQDTNGKEIYEGDIVLGKSWGAYHKAVVEYYNFGFLPFISVPVEVALCFDDAKNVTILGNIHDNPELLEGK